MSRYDLTDFEWRVIEQLLPNKPRGGLQTKVVDAQGITIRLDHLGPHTIVLVDKAYDADRIRELIEGQEPRQTSGQIQSEVETLLQQTALPRALPDQALLIQA